MSFKTHFEMLELTSHAEWKDKDLLWKNWGIMDN